MFQELPRKTVDAQKVLEYLKTNRDLHRDLFYDKQNMQVLGMFKAYRDAYEFVYKLAKGE